MIVTIRTDNPMAEVGLFETKQQLRYETWQAHRQLSETIHNKIKTMLISLNKDWSDISGVVFYAGPGSFTGLRIGASIANAFELPVANTTGDNWIAEGLTMLEGQTDKLAIPEYGAAPHITERKK